MSGFGTRRRHRAGRLRHIVRLQEQNVTGKDDRGRKVFTWKDVIPDLSVSIETLSGTEAEAARQLVSAATLRVEFRADSRVTPQMRFLHGDREIYIGFRDNIDEAGRWMYAICAETELK